MTFLSFNSLRVANVTRCESERPHGFGHKLTQWSVAEWGSAAAGECGEANNIAKKMIRIRDGMDEFNRRKGDMSSLDDYKKKLAKEIADTIIYCDLWAASQGINLADAVHETFNAVSNEIGSMVKL
jgi:NTP pyrophosphatase (non-canonical NTP hydrolase)